MGGVETFEHVGRLVRTREDADLASASQALPRGAYTSLRTYGGRRVLRLAAHLARLRTSVAGGDVLDAVRLREAMAAALDATGHPESRLRVTWSPPRLFVSVEAFTKPAEELFARGVRCALVEVRRERPGAKDSAFVATAREAASGLPPGVHEGLMVAEDGAVLEGLSSNVFFVHGGVLRTEEERVLPGVTRAVVLELAAGLLPVERRALHHGEIAGASECFLTSASREVLPVVEVSGVAVGDGPGPVARALRVAFAELVAREAERV